MNFKHDIMKKFLFLFICLVIPFSAFNQNNNNQKANSTQKTTFYNTWQAGLTDGSFRVAGSNGYPSVSPVFTISNSRISVSGYSETDDKWVYDFVTTKDNGARVYRGSKYIGSLEMRREIILSPDRKSFNLVTSSGYGNNLIKSSITNFVADSNIRNKIIAQNKGRVSAPNMALFNSIMENPYSSPATVTTNNSSGKELTTKEIKARMRANCVLCAGSGINPSPETSTSIRMGYTHDNGKKCKYCGWYSYHFHDKCPSCTVDR